MANGDAVREKAFWEWIEENYSTEQVAVLRGDPKYKAQPEQLRAVLDYWQTYVYQPPPLSLGRPQAEKYGLTGQDWQVLETVMSNPERLESELRGWIDRGYINQYQARDIWDELARRQDIYRTQIQYGLYETPEDREARVAREEQARLEEWWAKAPEALRYAPETYEQILRERTWQKARREIEYEPGLEQLRTEFAGEVPQTETWRDWFRSMYPRLTEQFETTLPEFKMTAYPGMTAEEAKVKEKETWATWLRKKKPELKEQWYGLSPYQRGERPSAYAPRVQMVGF